MLGKTGKSSVLLGMFLRGDVVEIGMVESVLRQCSNRVSPGSGLILLFSGKTL